MRTLLLIALLGLSGCAASPYAKFAVGYQIDDWSDWYVRTERDWQCDRNLPFQGELGFEWTTGWSAFYEHQSWILCGGPLPAADGRPELYRDAVWVAKKFGGVK